MAWTGAQYTITGTATKLSTILGIAAGDMRHFKQVDIKNAAGAVNNLFIGPSTVTAVPAFARIELTAGQGFSFHPGGSQYPVFADDIYLIGTANAANIAFISATY